MTRPCKCGECAFFKNEDANGYGHCIITLNQYRCDDLCKFKEDHMSDVETLRALHHYQKWRRGGEREAAASLCRRSDDRQCDPRFAPHNQRHPEILTQNIYHHVVYNKSSL